MLRTLARPALGLLLPLILAACSTPSAPSAPAAFYGDGLDHSWTASAQEGQQLLSTLTAPLKAQAVDMGVTLSLTASNGWGPIELNTSNGETAAGDGKTITMKGKTYSTGLGVHGDSEIHIKATGLVTPDCTRFKADIGIDDEVGVNGKYSSVVFQVFADGEKLYDSGLVTGSTPTKSIDIPVGGKSDLRFVVTHGPDLNYYDHADWADARLDCSPTQATPSMTLDKSSLDIYHKHTGTLHATFANFPAGPVQLSLVANPSLPSGTRGTPPLVLQTNTVTLDSSGPQTRDVVIGAPDPVNRYNTDPQANFQLIALVSGQQVAEQTVTLQELPINFTASINPKTVTGKGGGSASAIVTVTADPPLDGPVNLTPFLLVSDYRAHITSIGPTTGTGAVMQTTVDFTFDASTSSEPVTYDQPIAIRVEGVSDSYRDTFYGNSPSTSVTFVIQP